MSTATHDIVAKLWNLCNVLRDDNDELPEPAVLAQAAIGELEAAIAELQGILQELGEEISL